LKGGVSLLGAGAKHVTISSTLSISGGSGEGSSLLRGFALSSAAEGLVLDGTVGTKVEQVRLQTALKVGIDARGAKQLVIANVQLQKVLETSLTVPSDAGIDAGSDAGSDAGADAGPDAGSDAGSEAGADAGSDAGSGAGVDASQAGAGGGQGSTTKTFGIGIMLAEGSTATITGCAVQGSGTQGILVNESSVTLKDSAILDSGLFGVVIECPEGCKGVAGSTISGATITRSNGIGLLVNGATLAASDCDIGHTRYRAGFARGVQLQGKAKVELEGTRIHHSAAQGLVMDDVTGKLTQCKVDSNQERGIWLQGIAKPGVLLESNDVSQNELAGVGATGSMAVTIKGGRVESTRKLDITIGGKTYKVGDGVQVLKRSEVAISGAALKGNERVGVLVDDARVSVSGTSISGGEAALVVQNAKVADQTLKGVSAVTPATPYIVSSTELVGSLPLPIP
jgi:hypothetical protein